MPELPDVEQFKRIFDATGRGKTIRWVRLTAPELLKAGNAADLKRTLAGKRLLRSRRRGKYLILDSPDLPKTLILHFGMTGNFRYLPRGGGAVRFSRLVLGFATGGELHWTNLRKLGRIFWVREAESLSALRDMGPEPLALSRSAFLNHLHRWERSNVKAFLMNQRKIAGIGNEYSDEILYRAGIHPRRKIRDLTARERSTLFREMQRTLQQAIAVGPPTGTFGPSWLTARRSTDMRCPRNPRHALRKETIAGRSAVFCPVHQTQRPK
ncbi:MAG: Fpg/Nei family DNA glycosylase [Nitrospinaceae bacterium]|nr:Fpg/Nei family DNA glycosylase [Nitrospinaceae bacterium]NIS85462.1 Fpg/Nei family DNA glycosylase [Nitrospinaceae bacterium]NIT82296.1 Fpg/Nei family DNA glycosylase [Nitrospinaceae bacterium]NIU96666.1 Fpg/Nei family DNA glycosylase [Nitrospinaceae bacterium]NIY15515.1 Fpg/Nei family DNA glycosylase [Nitrospinaceae bacterium]